MDITERTRRRLGRDTVGWFTTVNPSGRPITLPVWFLWDGDAEILIYSLNGAARLRNIAANPNVSFHLDGDHHGGEVVVVEGMASVDSERPPANENPAYLDRYRGYIAANGWTPEWFAGKYPVAIRIKIDNVRAW
jgi:PPOX class probable F420-dependent enzyme